jgi:hypothetical protein
LPHLHVLMHQDANLYEYKAKQKTPLQNLQQTRIIGGAALAPRTPLLQPTSGTASSTIQPIAAAPLSSTHAGLSATSSPLHAPGSSTVLAALQLDSQHRVDTPAPPVSSAPSAIPLQPLLVPLSPVPASAETPAPTPAPAPVVVSGSPAPCGLTSPSLLPQSDGWGDPGLFHLSAPEGAPSTDDPSMQLIIAEMQERQRMEELDQQGLLWE